MDDLLRRADLALQNSRLMRHQAHENLVHSRIVTARMKGIVQWTHDEVIMNRQLGLETADRAGVALEIRKATSDKT